MTAAAGLSSAPTRHRIQTPHGARWTNCAYDAPGILGALGADGEITSSSPLTGQPIQVAFEHGHPDQGDVVLFLADQPEGCRPNDDWWPNVNLFEDEGSALRWAKSAVIPRACGDPGGGNRARRSGLAAAGPRPPLVRQWLTRGAGNFRLPSAYSLASSQVRSSGTGRPAPDELGRNLGITGRRPG